jgi:hypothetical protein
VHVSSPAGFVGDSAKLAFPHKSRVARELLLATGMRKLKTIDLAALDSVHGGDGAAAAPDPSACPGGNCGGGAGAAGGGGGSGAFGGGRVLAGLGSVLNPIMSVVQTAIQSRHSHADASAAAGAPQQGAPPQGQPPMPSAMGGGGGGGGGRHHGGVNVSIKIG